MYNENSVGVEQPVRFYKIVALSFLVLTLILFGVIIFMSSKRAMITIVTKNDPIDITTRVKIGAVSAGADIEGTSTTTLVTYENNYEPTGSRQEEGTSTGYVTLHNDSSASQSLVATTRLLTQDNILFRLKDKVVVPANGTVRAEVYADKKGKESDILPQTKFTIPGLNEEKQKEIYASSEEPMTGGLATVGVLSSEDYKKAELDMKDRLLAEGKKYFEETYKDTSVVVTLLQDSVESNTEIGEEVSKFTLTGKATIIGIMYDKSVVETWAREALKKREMSADEIVEPSENPPTISFDEYESTSGVATVQVFYDGIATLNPESSTIQKNMFFGKTKDEVRRYLLPLDHVHEVDVEFTPAWITKVPFVAEHVTVVVKSI
ncbi:MAG: hypothetical protein V1848_00570 [Candidatus Magasanikbacteria bacterium]